MERQGHVPGKVGPLEGEGRRRRLAHVGRHADRARVGLQTGILITLGRLNADDHLLCCAKGRLVVGKGVHCAITIATSIPSPIDVIGVTNSVIAIDVEGMARTRRVLVGTIHNGAASREFGLHECPPLGVAVVGIAQVVGLEQQLSRLLVVLKELHGPQDVLAIGTAAADGIVHLLNLTDVAHQVGNRGSLLIIVLAPGIVIEHVGPVKGRGRQFGQLYTIGRYHIGRHGGRLVLGILPVVEHHR